MEYTWSLLVVNQVVDSSVFLFFFFSLCGNYDTRCLDCLQILRL